MAGCKSPTTVVPVAMDVVPVFHGETSVTRSIWIPEDIFVTGSGNNAALLWSALTPAVINDRKSDLHVGSRGRANEGCNPRRAGRGPSRGGHGRTISTQIRAAAPESSDLSGFGGDRRRPPAACGAGRLPESVSSGGQDQIQAAHVLS